MSTHSIILSRLKQRYLSIRIVELLLLALLIGLLVWGALTFFASALWVKVAAASVCALTGVIIRYFQLRLHRVTEQTLADFLNARYQQLHASTDLLLVQETELSVLSQLQRIKTQRDLEQLAVNIQFPTQIKTFSVLAFILVFAVLALVYSGLSWSSTLLVPNPGSEQNITQSTVKNIPAELKKASLTITPPAYTGIKSYAASDFNLHIPEGSQVQWSLTFSGAIHAANLITSFQDTVSFKSNEEVWRTKLHLTKSGFYQLSWRDSTWHISDYYKIDIIPDQQPVIKLTNLNQFTQIEHDSKQTIEVNPVITDDYGLTDAYIIATVSKGSGESVKFREEKLLFTSPSAIQGKLLNLRRSIDLNKMGMEPGDELYFYVEAIDNKIPGANRARTETYFVALKDTAQDVVVADGGLGVDLMPEYFRSQRQIIIDTEKLIQEQKKIAKKDFNFRSNELGYDQKVLRLRYGQFMGEEFETGIGPAEHVVPEEDHEESHEKKIENLAKSFGHQHDTENEHNLVDQKKSGAAQSHQHKEENSDPDKPVNLMAEFMHNHDSEESATFLFQSVKLKLKAALTQMWDAELYLRLNEPQKSLPYQYIALRLLKEISNDSRIYVHRTGFEPPPIKEEKRLTADLDEIFSTTQNYEAEVKKYFPKITDALRLTEQLLSRKNSVPTKAENNILLQSGNELAAVALENPAVLDGLTALQHITGSNNDLRENTIQHDLLILRKAYWLALPKKPTTATKRNTFLHALDEQFIRQLQIEP